MFLWSQNLKSILDIILESTDSIEIIMTKDGEVTRNVAKEAFADVGRAVSLFEKLANNLATPIDLPYIMEDRIAY